MDQWKAVAASTRYSKEIECRAAGQDGDSGIFKFNAAQQAAITVSLAEAKRKTVQSLPRQDRSFIEGHTHGERKSARHGMMGGHIERSLQSIQPNGNLSLWLSLSKKKFLLGPNAPKQ